MEEAEQLLQHQQQEYLCVRIPISQPAEAIQHHPISFSAQWWAYRQQLLCYAMLDDRTNFFHDLNFLNPTVLLCVILHQPIGHFSKKLRKKLKNEDNRKSENLCFKVFFLNFC